MTESKPNRIAELRKLSGRTQQQLGDTVGAHWITISKLERGEMQLTQEWMEKLAPPLGVQPQDLLPEGGMHIQARADGLDLTAERIREARKSMGLSQAELAKRVGVSQPLIDKIEKGRVGSSRHVNRIAEVLGVSVEPAREEGAANPLLAEIAALRAENARLKAAIRALTQ